MFKMPRFFSTKIKQPKERIMPTIHSLLDEATFSQVPVQTAYEGLLNEILNTGEERNDRTGVGTIGIFGAQMRFNLAGGFPLITTKRVFWRGVVEELLWILRGETNVDSLNLANVHIWDEWADENGELGPVYGKQWRRWEASNPLVTSAFGSLRVQPRYIDQIANVIAQIRTNPNSRRLIVSAWNPSDVDQMALPPCHTLFQFYVQDGRLSCQLYQRSADCFLGVPFNIASYALLTHIVAHLTGLEVGEFIHTIGDAHIYNNHLEQVRTQLKREHKGWPKLTILCAPKEDPKDYTYADFKLEGYDPHPAIKGDVAV